MGDSHGINSYVQINLYNLFTMKIAIFGSGISALTDYHVGHPRSKLDHAVRDLVERQTGRRPLGPVRVLTRASR